MKARTATIKTNAHIRRWSLAKIGVRTNYRCPTCLNKDVWRTHEHTYFWCMVCPYEVGVRPKKDYEIIESDATSSSVKYSDELEIIRQAIPGISLQDAIDVLRSLRC